MAAANDALHCMKTMNHKNLLFPWMLCELLSCELHTTKGGSELL
jgi:hypothetical protein